MRAILNECHTQTPYAETLKGINLVATLKIIGPKGDTLVTEPLTYQPVFFSYVWKIQPKTQGGDYKFILEYNEDGFPSAERKFEIRNFQNPRLNTQIEFLKKAYSADETATVTLEAKRSEGGYVPEGSKVTATARIDGKEAFKGVTKMLKKKKKKFFKFLLVTQKVVV